METSHSCESRNLRAEGANCRRRRIRRLRFRAKRFRLSPEWCILIKRLKVPPFRRKPESHSPKANRLRFRAKGFPLSREWNKGGNDSL
ncbi:MAG: hypothetical protein ACR2QC_02635 [Gammaproteobacteria bacterium]